MSSSSLLLLTSLLRILRLTDYSSARAMDLPLPPAELPPQNRRKPIEVESISSEDVEITSHKTGTIDFQGNDWLSAEARDSVVVASEGQAQVEDLLDEGLPEHHVEQVRKDSGPGAGRPPPLNIPKAPLM